MLENIVLGSVLGGGLAIAWPKLARAYWIVIAWIAMIFFPWWAIFKGGLWLHSALV